MVAPTPCAVRKEPIFNSILVALLQSELLPNGSVIDAGAHTGTESCLYARAAPARVVHAIEPLYTNLVHIATTHAARWRNIRPIQAGLGAREETVQPSSGMHAVGQMFTPEKVRRRREHSATAAAPLRNLERRAQWSRTQFVVRRLDALFAGEFAGESLALAHLDVEGSELDVIRGGASTLRRDLPIVATELFVHANPAYSVALLALLHDLEYDSFLVEEVCVARGRACAF